MQAELVNAKMVIALKAARVSLGWSQEELANLTGMAKTTIARLETMEGGIRADQLAFLLTLYSKNGIELDFITSDEISIRIKPDAVQSALLRLKNDELRRADRRKPRGLLDMVASSEPSTTEVNKSNKIKGLLG